MLFDYIYPKSMFWSFLYNPLYEYFKKGPTFLGGYGGLPEEDICTQISNVPSYVWYKNVQDCKVLIERKYESFCIGIFIFLYLLFLYKLINYFWFRFFIVKPILNELKDTLHNIKFVIQQNTNTITDNVE